MAADVWTCPRCAGTVDSGGQCPSCGFDRMASRSGLAGATRATTGPASSSWRVCAGCGTTRPPSDARCSTCGTEATLAAAPPPPVAQGWAPAPVATPYQPLPVPVPLAPAREPEYDPLRLIAGIVAAIVFGYAGLQLVGLRTVSGTTAAEVFYQNVGVMCFGLAALSVARGPAADVTAGCGPE